MNRFRLCGILFDSELELPGWRVSGEDDECDVRISLGEVPDALDQPVDCRKAFQAAPGIVLVTIPQVAKFLVRDGREIIVQPSDAADDHEVQTYLTGSVLGALLHQRGVLPLHASAFDFNGCAIALAGGATVGKSTTAAAVQQRGYDLIGDDLCPVQIVNKVPVVSPGIRRLKLRPDSSRWLGLDRARSLQPHAYGKIHFDLPDANGDRRLPLRSIYILKNRPSDAVPSITRVHGVDRLRALFRQTFRYGFLNGLRLRNRHLHLCLEILRSVEIYECWRPRDLSKAQESVDFLMDHLSERVAETTSSGRFRLDLEGVKGPANQVVQDYQTAAKKIHEYHA